MICQSLLGLHADVFVNEYWAVRGTYLDRDGKKQSGGGELLERDPKAHAEHWLCNENVPLLWAVVDEDSGAPRYIAYVDPNTQMIQRLPAACFRMSPAKG